MEKQTAGRNSLGEFAPKFAQLNDDILFGEVWSREDKLSLRDRSLVTICVFMGKGMVDSSLKYHLINARKELLEEQRNKLVEKQKNINATIERLDYKLKLYDEIISGKRKDFTETI